MRRMVIGLLAAGMLVVAGCEPAHLLHLPGTTWSVTSIDRQPAVDSPLPTITFDEGNNAVLRLACGDVSLRWVWDTDGAALDLSARDADMPDACASASEQDAAVLAAVGEIVEWRILDDDLIAFSGPSREIGLQRVKSD
jgi:hypothetical protein